MYHCSVVYTPPHLAASYSSLVELENPPREGVTAHDVTMTTLHMTSHGWLAHLLRTSAQSLGFPNTTIPSPL